MLGEVWVLCSRACTLSISAALVGSPRTHRRAVFRRSRASFTISLLRCQKRCLCLFFDCSIIPVEACESQSLPGLCLSHLPYADCFQTSISDFLIPTGCSSQIYRHTIAIPPVLVFIGTHRPATRAELSTSILISI